VGAPRRIVVNSVRADRSQLDRLVAEWIRDGVKYVGVVGVDASDIEDHIDWLCMGDGSNPYFMLTAFHEGNETLEDALELADLLADSYPGPTEVVEL
jgi:hypothetical protein